jgi:hypothetical protein
MKNLLMKIQKNSSVVIVRSVLSILFVLIHVDINAQYSRLIHATKKVGYGRHADAVEFNNQLLHVNLIESTTDTLRIDFGLMNEDGETYGYKSQTILGILANRFCISGISKTGDGNITLSILALVNNSLNKLVYVKYDYVNDIVLSTNELPSAFHKGFTRSRQKNDSLITYVYDNSLSGFYRISCSIDNINQYNYTLVTDSISYQNSSSWVNGSKHTELLITANGNEFFTVNSRIIKRNSNLSYETTLFNGYYIYSAALAQDDVGNIAVITSNKYTKLSQNLNVLSQGTIAGLEFDNYRYIELYYLNQKWILYNSTTNFYFTDRIEINSDFTVNSIFTSEYRTSSAFNVVKGNNGNYIIGGRAFYSWSTTSVVNEVVDESVKPFIDFDQVIYHGAYRFYTSQYNQLFSYNDEGGLKIKHDGLYKQLIRNGINYFAGIAESGDTLGLIGNILNNNVFHGPYTPAENQTMQNSDKYSRGYYVDKYMINEHLLNYTNPNYKIPFGISEWPAHGDISLGQAPNLAPYNDINNNGIYDPQNGDYPIIFGDRCVLNIYHQKPFSEQNGLLPYKIECYQYYYVFDCDTLDVLKNTIFLNHKYKMLEGNFYDFIAGTLIDYNIGGHTDDYVGTNVNLGMVYAYNSTPYDDNSDGLPGFYEYPPASGMLTLRGTKLNDDGIDNNIGIDQNETINGCGFEDGIVDNEYYTLESSYSSYYGEQSIQNYYNRFQGKNSNGNFPQVNGVDVRYVYFGNSDPFFYGSWGNDHGNDNSEISLNNNSGDRFIGGFTGKTNLIADDPTRNTYEIVTAYITAMDSITPNADVLSKLFNFGTQLKTLYNNGSNLCGTILAPNAAIPEIKKDNILIYPNPTEGLLHIVRDGNQAATELLLLNSQGMIIERARIDETDFVFSLQNYPSGLYLIRIGDKSVKVIKR